MMIYFSYFVLFLLYKLACCKESICNETWKFCSAIGECVPNDCQNSVSPKSIQCGPGQHYCAERQACVPYCPGADKTTRFQRSTSCHGELQFCFSQGICAPPTSCDDTRPLVCDDGAIFCALTQTCERHACVGLGETSCPSGQTFCINSGTCHADCSDRISGPSVRCPAGLTFCVNSGACQTDCNDASLPLGPSVRCSAGLIFCVNSGACQTDCNDAFPAPSIHCSTGRFFCHSSQSCVLPGQCSKQTNPSPSRKCQKGQIFCHQKQMCTTVMNCATRGTICGPGKAFCLSTGRCEIGKCRERTAQTFSMSCPLGTIYCYESRTCVPTDVGCNGNGVQCTPGTRFCQNLGRCSRDCGIQESSMPEQSDPCPVAPGSFNYTSCLHSADCSSGASCCRDPASRHMQCMDLLTASVSTSNTSGVCQRFELYEENYDTGIPCIGLNCPPGSVCCKDKCLSNGCPLPTLYCAITDSCKEICGRPCPLGKSFCITLNVCTTPLECELGSTYTIPTMMPGPLMVRPNGVSSIGESVWISKLFSEGDVEIMKGSMRVHDILEGEGKFEAKTIDTEWTNVKIGDILQATMFLRYIHEGSYDFSFAALNVTYMETNATHLIVQLIAPLPPPIEMDFAGDMNLLEDHMAIASLPELFQIRREDSSNYTSALLKAEDTIKAIRHSDFLDFSHSATKAWVGQITRISTIGDSSPIGFFNGEKTSSNEELANLTISFTGEEYSPLILPVFDAHFSFDGDKWESLPLTKSLNVTANFLGLSQLLFKIEPRKNKHGNVKVSFTLSTGETSEEKSQIIGNFKVMPQNDPPVRKIAQVRPIQLTTDNPEGQLSVQELVLSLYDDVDGDQLGVAILAADYSSLGAYYYSRNNQYNWIKITGLLAKLPQLEEDPINMKRSRISASSFLTKSIRSARPKRETYENPPTTNKATIPVIILPPEAIIKYKTSSGESFSILESESETKLHLVAYDIHNPDALKEILILNISYPISDNCQENEDYSFALEPASVTAISYDCNGRVQVLQSDFKTVDKCNVCGGDGSSCEDCKNVAFGDAFYDNCNNCVTSSEAANVQKDCTGDCKMLFEIKSSICLPNGTGEFIFCDNSTDSGAFIDLCGNCVGGTTGLIPNGNIDSEICPEENYEESCKFGRVPNKKWDICSQSCIPVNEESAENCRSLGAVEPNYVDIACRQDSIEASIEVVGLDESYALANCKAVKKNTEEEISAGANVALEGKIKTSFLRLSVGTYNIKCAFKVTGNDGTSTEEVMTTSESDYLTVVDSKLVTFHLEKDTYKPGDTIKFKSPHITGANMLRPIAIINLQGEGDIVQELMIQNKATDQQNEVGVILPRSITAGEINLGLVLSSEAVECVKSKMIFINMVKINVEAPPPVCVYATLSETGSLLTLEFDQNIQLQDNSCVENIVSNGSFGTSPVCDVSNSHLNIKLGYGATVSANSLISLTQNNAITGEVSGSVKGPIASCSVNISQEERKTKDFTLEGDTLVCNRSNAKFRAIVHPSLLSKEAKIAWNVTWDKGNVQWQQAKVLEIWDSIEIISSSFSENSFEVSVPGSAFLQDIDYLIVAYAVLPGGSETNIEKVKIKNIQDGQALLLNIKGPAIIFADKTYTYQTNVALCLDENEIPNLQYAYSLGQDAFLDSEVDYNSKYLTITKGAFKPGKTYEITALVYDIDTPTINARGSIFVTTVTNESPTIELFPNSLRTGNNLEIQLQVIPSPHLETSSMTYRFTCKTPEKDFCLVAANGHPQLFENFMPQEELITSTLTIPPKTFSPGPLIIAVEAIDKKTGQKAVAESKLEISTDITSKIEVSPITELILTSKTIIIDGIVTSTEDVELWWESVSKTGNEYVNLTNKMVFGSRKLQIKSDEAQSNLFSLIIPPSDPDQEWNGLKGDSSYTFRLIARGYGNSYAFVEIPVKTAPVPKSAVFTVEPSSGEALITDFTFRASDFVVKQNELPLKVSLGYESCDKSVLVGTTYLITLVFVVRDASFSTALPFLGEDVLICPIVKICNADQSCWKMASTAVKVTKPSEIEPQILTNLVNDVRESLLNGEYIAMELLNGIYSTLDKMGEGAKEAIEFIRMETDDIMIQKLRDLKSRIAISENVQREAEQFLERFLSSWHISNSSVIATLMLDLADMIFETKNVLSNTITEVDESPSRVKRELNNYRRRPQFERLSQPTTESNVDYISVVKAALLLQEWQLSEKEESPLAMREKKDRFISGIDNYLTRLCTKLDPGTRAQIYGDNVRFMVRREVLQYTRDIGSLSLVDNLDKTEQFIGGKSEVIFNKALEGFRNWQCLDEPRIYLCSDVCIATSVYGSVFKSPRTRADAPGKMSTNLARVSLLNPKSGAFLNSTNSKDNIIKYSLPLATDIADDDETLQCFGWTGESWSPDACSNVPVIRRSNTQLFECDCPYGTFAAVFSMKEPIKRSQDESPTNPGTSIVRRQTYILRIDGDYATSVEGRKEEFSDLLITKFSEALHVPKASIKILDIYKGSIIAEIELAVNEGPRTAVGGDFDTAASTLEEIIKDGFTIRGLDKEELQIFNYQDHTVQAVDDSLLPILIGGIVGGVLLLAVVLFILAIYFNKKKRMDKVTPLNNSGTIPTYMGVQYEHGLDGTVGSLGKGGSIASSIRSRNGGSPNADDIPAAFRYKTPTKQQMKRSSPIPDHLLRKIHDSSRGLLPGSPDEPVRVNHEWPSD